MSGSIFIRLLYTQAYSTSCASLSRLARRGFMSCEEDHRGRPGQIFFLTRSRLGSMRGIYGVELGTLHTTLPNTSYNTPVQTHPSRSSDILPRSKKSEKGLRGESSNSSPHNEQFVALEREKQLYRPVSLSSQHVPGWSSYFINGAGSPPHASGKRLTPAGYLTCARSSSFGASHGG